MMNGVVTDTDNGACYIYIYFPFGSYCNMWPSVLLGFIPSPAGISSAEDQFTTNIASSKSSHMNMFLKSLILFLMVGTMLLPCLLSLHVGTRTSMSMWKRSLQYDTGLMGKCLLGLKLFLDAIQMHLILSNMMKRKVIYFLRLGKVLHMVQKSRGLWFW